MRIIDMPEFRDKTEVMTFDISSKLSDIVDAMAEKNYGAVVILEDKKPVGIFTERDLLRRISAKRLDIETTPIAEVMTTALKTANAEDRVSECLRRMSKGRFRHLPVIDAQKNLIGMLSQGDFVAYTLSDAIYRTTMSAKAGFNLKKLGKITLLLVLLIYTAALFIMLTMLGY